MKRNIPEFKYIDAWQILCRERLNGTIVDDKSMGIILRIENLMSKLKVMGDDEMRFFWIRATKGAKSYEWLQVMTAHYKDFHYLMLSDGQYKTAILKNKDGVEYDSGTNCKYDYEKILSSLEAHVNAVINWICEDPDGYNKYVNQYLPHHKRYGDILMKTLIAIDNRYEDKDESRNIKAIEKVMATIPTEYSRKTLRNYISVWSAAYRILVKSRAEYDNDRFIQKKLQDCTEMDDIELFKRYNSKGHEIAGLDLESEEDYKKWYESNSSFHCMDIAYARIHLGFRGESKEYREVGGPYHFSIWFNVGGYWDEVMDIAIGLFNQGIVLEVNDAEDILEFLRKDYMVGFRPRPDKYMNRDGVKVQRSLPHIGDVSREVYWKIIRATSWHKEPEIRPVSDVQSVISRCIGR